MAPVVEVVLLPAHAQTSPPPPGGEDTPKIEPTQEPPDPRTECLAREGAWAWDEKTQQCVECVSPNTGHEDCQVDQEEKEGHGY